MDIDGTAGAAGAGCGSVGFAKAVGGNGDVLPRGADPSFANDGAGSAGFAWVELASCDGAKDAIGLEAPVLPRSEGVDGKLGVDGWVCGTEGA